MKNLVGTLIGAAIDRRDGDSGAKGAAIGYMTSGLAKTTLKLGLIAAVLAGAAKLVSGAGRR